MPVHPAAAPAARLPAIVALLILLHLGIVWLDALTPLGYAVWVLYVACVGVTLLQPRPDLPLWVAATGTLVTMLGYQLSPSGIDSLMAVVNRSMGVFILWVVALVIRRALQAQQIAGDLLWIEQAMAALAVAVRGDKAPTDLGASAARLLCERLGAEAGALYLREADRLVLLGGIALPHEHPRTLPCAGLLGEVCVTAEPRQVAPVPTGQLRLRSALADSQPAALLLSPLTADGQVVGVLELAVLAPSGVPPVALQLLRQAAEPLGVALRSAEYRQRLQQLLEQTQRQSEELQAQQETLKTSNEELQQSSEELLRSQATLEEQQSELEQVNAQLLGRTGELEEQRRALLQVQQQLQANARSLELASRYKSEFLANMSHELRTPLNSALILSQLLADNREGNLNDEQVRYAEAIRTANNDLLVLISDILDLSKIEAGHLQLARESIPLGPLCDGLRTMFEPLARDKALALDVALLPDAPQVLLNDATRLAQILRNLLANAVKFTESGVVALRVGAGSTAGMVRFEVVDTGIGIALDQQEVIFEAFRQADGSTSRRFGGTGLGLSISRELAQQMGGTISVSSQPGAGSRFTLEIPQDIGQQVPLVLSPAPHHAAASPPVVAQTKPAGPAPVPVQQPFAGRPGRTILIVEDDQAFGQALAALVGELDFDGHVAASAAEAMQIASTCPVCGILLDINLPDVSGLTLLEQLKSDPATRHLPVHIVSALERHPVVMERGAVGYVLKPADREALLQAVRDLEQRTRRDLQRLLLVEDEPALRQGLQSLLARSGLQIDSAGSISQAVSLLAAGTYDCMVTDLALPDGSGFELLEKMATEDQLAFPPVIVYTGRQLTSDEELRLRRHSRSIIVKGARSPERLLDEVTLFLHSVESELPPEQQRILRQVRRRDAVLEGRTFLLAEDDVRNVFALTSVLEPLGVRLLVARNGREALDVLNKQAVDLVLMDVMMPEMDGLEAMRRIRADPRLQSLPVLALTAKAMPDDRRLCLEAGANDYVPKPVDIDRLVTLCRIWTPR